MASYKVRDNIYSVGAVDWGVRNFHGYEVPRGTTYNAYLIIDEKITLIDTVKAPFNDELIANISEVVDPRKIDYIISNHTEPDHSGTLPYLSEFIPNAKIYCTAAANKELKAIYAQDFNTVVVKPGETLNTGKYTFRFVPMPMVHWPDSMSTYLEEEKILFSNDALGQHIASEEKYDDELGRELFFERSGDYYANIVFPFGKQVTKLLADISALDINLVCPAHGVMLRGYIGEAVQKYSDWATDVTDDKSAVVIYDTMWGATAKHAKKIADRWRAEGLKVEEISLKDKHHSYAIAKLLDAKYIAVGSSTLNRNMLPSVAAFLTYMKGLRPQKRVGLAFGIYGWSGEAPDQIEAIFNELNFEILPKEKFNWNS